MRRYFTILLLMLSVSMSSAYAAEAGRIVFAVGDAQVASIQAVSGNAVQEGDEIVTGADGYVYVKTVDSGFLILRPNTQARVVSYRIDAGNPANTRVKLELVRGVARSISGEGVKHSRENFRFNTPVAAIGVRGTDFTVFTDQQTSRVTVISGGIVVSGFGGACKPEGGGPCEGGASRELFAHQAGQILQITKGQIAPQLVRNNALLPDAVVPPRSDEPSGKASGANASLTSADPNLEAQKGSTLLTAKLPETPVTPVPQPDVVIPPPEVVTPKPPEILWGRWQEVANLAADSEALAKQKAGNYEDSKILGAFFISRVANSELVLPKQGQASFTFSNGEAYLAEAGKTPVAATFQNPRLDVNFASREFSTSFTLQTPGAKVDLYASGDITLKGELYSNLFSSNATVSGYLGGANAREAAYLFKTTDSSNLSAFGATRWSR